MLVGGRVGLYASKQLPFDNLCSRVLYATGLFGQVFWEGQAQDKPRLRRCRAPNSPRKSPG